MCSVTKALVRSGGDVEEAPVHPKGVRYGGGRGSERDTQVLLPSSKLTPCLPVARFVHRGTVMLE